MSGRHLRCRSRAVGQASFPATLVVSYSYLPIPQNILKKRISKQLLIKDLLDMVAVGVGRRTKEEREAR